MKRISCTKLTTHLSRIQGQIEALKGYLNMGRSCGDVALLTKSILTSFSSVRACLIEEMIAEELAKKLTPNETERLRSILTLTKS
jgi:DNA-binding FrmR family transcriptional regulator